MATCHFDNLSDGQVNDDWNYYVFPNITINVFSDSILIQVFRPHPTDPVKSYYHRISLCLPVGGTQEIVMDPGSFGPEAMSPPWLGWRDQAAQGNTATAGGFRFGTRARRGAGSRSLKGPAVGSIRRPCIVGVRMPHTALSRRTRQTAWAKVVGRVAMQRNLHPRTRKRVVHRLLQDRSGNRALAEYEPSGQTKNTRSPASNACPDVRRASKLKPTIDSK